MRPDTEHKLRRAIRHLKSARNKLVEANEETACPPRLRLDFSAIVRRLHQDERLLVEALNREVEKRRAECRAAFLASRATMRAA